MKRVSVNVDKMHAFVIINNVGMMINADVNAKNQLIKVYARKNLFRIQVIVSVKVINHVMLVIMKTVSVGTKWLIN